VVRRPTPWFYGVVDENDRSLGPPADLLEAFKARQEDLVARGMCDEEAHNAVWAERDFEARYREDLDTDARVRNRRRPRTSP
jgi:hypothetical protein